MTLRLQIVSDLHLEFADTRIENAGSDILILSGDICVADYLTRSPASPYHDQALAYLDFFEHCSNEFNHVIYILGNHEYYHGEILESAKILKEALRHLPNLYVLDNEYVDLCDHRFIGGTLWTNITDPIAEMVIQGGLSDYRYITNKGYKIRPPLTSFFHQGTLSYFEKNIVENTVIVGHHAPSYQSIAPDYRTPSDKYLNYAYFTELSDFILDHPQIKLWTHGHVHSSHDYQIGETRVVCNPRGYCKLNHIPENPNYNPSKVIEL